MQVTLNTEVELIDYLNFLHQQNKLKEKFPSIILEDKEASEYITFCIENNTFTKEEITYEPNKEYIEWNGKKRWTESDIDKLGTLINEEYSIDHIAIEMKRTPKAIRHQANNSYNMIYRNDHWVSLNS